MMDLDRIDERNNCSSSAIDVNSNAILQLLEGEQEEAVSLLHAALNTSRAQLQAAGPRLRESLSQNYEAMICPVSLEDAMYTPSVTTVAPCDTFCIYRSVFSIEGPDCEEDALAPEVTAVILYNMAVVHHELGYDTSDKVCLDKALQLYNICRSVLSQTKQAKQSKLSIDLTLLDLALLNNMGQIYSVLLNHEQSLLLQQSLLAMIEQLNVIEQAQEDEVFDFFRSCALRSHRFPGPAPAA